MSYRMYQFKVKVTLNYMKHKAKILISNDFVKSKLLNRGLPVDFLSDAFRRVGNITSFCH